MNKRPLAVIAALSLVFAASCTPKQQRYINNQMPNNGQSTGQKQQPIQGTESSVSQMGDIRRVKITANSANVTTGCSGTTPVLHTAGRDSTLDVISQVSDWFAVKTPNNQIGFVPKQQVKPVVVENNQPAVTPDNLTAAPQATQSPAPGATTPKTPSAKTNSATLTSSEQQMITLINQARAQNNVPALQVDMQVTNIARLKAQDMIDNNYFSHNSPKYGSPFDMMKAFNISYVEAGENIAGNQSVQSAHNALMNSPGHRKNILNPAFTHIGLGIRAGGPYGNMFSQMFVSKPK